jgi:hypothetical protein
VLFVPFRLRQATRLSSAKSCGATGFAAICHLGFVICHALRLGYWLSAIDHARSALFAQCGDRVNADGTQDREYASKDGRDSEKQQANTERDRIDR